MKETVFLFCGAAGVAFALVVSLVLFFRWVARRAGDYAEHQRPEKPETPEEKAQWEAYRKQQDAAYNLHMERAEKNHPNPNCPMRKYAALHFYGEPAFSVGEGGKIEPDVCICKRE